MTMIERVAKAIYDTIEGPVNNADFKRQLAQWELAKNASRAAIYAMREPEVEMLAAFWRQKNCGTQAIGERGDLRSDYDAYRAMIDKALGDEA